MKDHLQKIIENVSSSGAAAGRFFDLRDLVIEDSLAERCKTPRCPGYGSGGGCPPHVPGPEKMRSWKEESSYGLAIRMDVPFDFHHSNECDDVMRLLHELVAKVELEAVHFNYRKSKGFAGGSCKKIFCSFHDSCLKVSSSEVCRHPLQARPSMSGFGINVQKMMEAAGWKERESDQSSNKDDSMGYLAGLVLISK